MKILQILSPSQLFDYCYFYWDSQREPLRRKEHQIADVVCWVAFLLFLPRETSEMLRHFVLITKTTQPHPRSFRLTDQFSGNYTVQLKSFFTHRKPLPNLVNCSWLWWIIREIFANQKRRNNYLERIIKNSSAWVAFKWVVPPRSQNVDPIFKELCIQKDAPGSKISHFYQAKKYSVHVIST